MNRIGPEADGIMRILIDKYYFPISRYRTSVFLCGADLREDNSIRSKLASILTTRVNAWKYDVKFPEDLFQDYLYNKILGDLMSLELMLARGVDVIIVIPESPGSFAELGAFSVNENIRSKLLCVVDQRYKRDKSFIRLGPINLVRQNAPERVIYVDPSLPNKDAEKIVRLINKVSRDSIVDRVTILNLPDILVPLLYTFDPLDIPTANTLLSGYVEFRNELDISIEIALKNLLSKRIVSKDYYGGWRLTEKGVRDFKFKISNYRRSKPQIYFNILDKIRLEVLNWRLRDSKLSLPKTLDGTPSAYASSIE